MISQYETLEEKQEAAGANIYILSNCGTQL